MAENLPDVARDGHLDFLRAAAITAVVVYHTVQMSPVPLPRLMVFASAGQYGVDLFFVLSGWLIGGLYWRENSRFGSVDLLRFWSRRWLRTIPPYLAALALAWMAVRIQRGEPFNWGYLFFIQNYYVRLPFFLVSWSLCIEEHFYVFLPLLLVPFKRTSAILILFVTLVLIAPVSRFMVGTHESAPSFGFAMTATHLRMEGLLLGFAIAYLRVAAPSGWRLAVRYSPWAIVISTLLLIASGMAEAPWMYRAGLTALAAGLTSVLVLMVSRRSGRLLSSALIRGIALSSYSVYLTHSLMIHLARSMMSRYSGIPWTAYFPLVLALIFIGGAAFYFGIERTAIQLRDWWAPRRSKGHLRLDPLPPVVTQGDHIE